MGMTHRSAAVTATVTTTTIMTITMARKTALTMTVIVSVRVCTEAITAKEKECLASHLHHLCHPLLLPSQTLQQSKTTAETK